MSQRSMPFSDSDGKIGLVPDWDSLGLFALAALALLLVPGPAVLYIVAQSVDHGRLAGLASVAGVHLGTIVHTVAAAIGLSALIVSSALAFSIVKYAGVAYLVYLGIRRLLQREPPGPVVVENQSLARLFWRGAVVNVLNPKTALFFLAFVPQFVDPARTVWSQVVVFGLVFVALGFCSDGLYAFTAGSVGKWLRRRRGILRYGSGSVYIGLGAVTALSRRS
jgi:threonine/homoserine/homoserine lactone efflux protein